MNNLRLLKGLLSMAAIGTLLLGFGTAPAFGDDAKAPGNIITMAQQAGRFTTFLKVVKAAGLTRKLQSGEFTVFAPTDDAFAKMAPGALDDLMKPANKAQLTSLVEYHIVPRLLPASMFTKTSSQTHSASTLANRDLTFSSDNAGGVMVNGAKVEEADIKASNGLIHAIDAVLTPPTK